MDLEKLKKRQMEQMKKKGCLPKSDTEVLLHLVEEVGEVCEAIREKQTKIEFVIEVADVLWQLNKLCWIHKINLEKAFIRKLDKNLKR